MCCDVTVSAILEALRECYPLAALDNLVSSYDKRYNLYKSMRTTINVALARKQFSEQLISALADLEVLLLSEFEKVFTNFHKPIRPSILCRAC